MCVCVTDTFIDSKRERKREREFEIRVSLYLVLGTDRYKYYIFDGHNHK